jgi:signal transduction histidine kinase
LLNLERTRSDDDIANRDDFLGIVSHDLRNLLGVISLNASTLAVGLSGASADGQSALCIQRIQRASTQMSRLIADLLDVVSIDAGKLALRMALTDVPALLAELVDIFQHAARSKDITLELGDGPLPMAWFFDGERIHQVLTNLLSNALKFTPPGGKVCLVCETVSDHLRFSVSDTGKGIPVDMQESVFKRFWQLGRNESRGLGLGLYISRCLVEAHGGAIWVESAVAEGGTFHFTLPANRNLKA